MENTVSGKPIFRKDIEWSRFECNSPFRWVAFDPLAGAHHYFSTTEKDFLDLFDGTRTVRDVISLIESEKPGTIWSLEKAHAFARLMAINHLLLTDELGNGKIIAGRQQRQRLLGNWGWILQPLSIRIPVVRPTFIIRLLSPVGSLLFNKITAWIVLLVFVGLLVNVTVLWDDIFGDLPAPSEVLRGDRLWMVFAALIIVKSCHELGHALACYRFTRKTGEMGVMFLAFAPCLYCDVSASWTTTAKWNRIAVALAGIYVEVILASLAVILFYIEGDQSFRVFMLYIFGICSLGTVLLNANPLVKYDGYFAFSDWLGIPNLSEQSSQAMTHVVQSLFSRCEMPNYVLDGSKLFLVCYWMLSCIYRLILVIAILWGINLLVRPLGLDLIVHYIALMIAGTYVMTAFLRFRSFIKFFDHWRDVKWINCISVLGTVFVIGYVFFAVPIPDSCIARGLVKFETMVPVYCQQDGRLVLSLDADRNVTQGETVALFENPLLQERLLELTSLRERLNTQALLRSELAVLNKEQDYQLPTLQKNLDIVEKQLDGLAKEMAQLAIVAPADGFLFHSNLSYQTPAEGVQLGKWAGFPLQPHNLGVWLDKGTHLGWIVNRNRPLIEAYVEEADFSEVKIGEKVDVLLDRDTQQSLNGRIVWTATESTNVLPAEFAGDWLLLSVPDPNGTLTTDRPKFRVVVQLEPNEDQWQLGSLASIKIHSASRTLFSRFQQYISRSLWDAARVTVSK
jgi:putative peptide zinc metalloprotease protein